MMVQNFLRGILIEQPFITYLIKHCEENKNLPKFSKSRRIKETGSVLNMSKTDGVEMKGFLLVYFQKFET
jgi:hypothetical protein